MFSFFVRVFRIALSAVTESSTLLDHVDEGRPIANLNAQIESGERGSKRDREIDR